MKTPSVCNVKKVERKGAHTLPLLKITRKISHNWLSTMFLLSKIIFNMLIKCLCDMKGKKRFIVPHPTQDSSVLQQEIFCGCKFSCFCKDDIRGELGARTHFVSFEDENLFIYSPWMLCISNMPHNVVRTSPIVLTMKHICLPLLFHSLRL